MEKSAKESKRSAKFRNLDSPRVMLRESGNPKRDLKVAKLVATGERGLSPKDPIILTEFAMDGASGLT